MLAAYAGKLTFGFGVTPRRVVDNRGNPLQLPQMERRHRRDYPEARIHVFLGHSCLLMVRGVDSHLYVLSIKQSSAASKLK